MGYEMRLKVVPCAPYGLDKLGVFEHLDNPFGSLPKWARCAPHIKLIWFMILVDGVTKRDVKIPQWSHM